jgi:glycosyltransferase involved in cell wall biosynthesis
MNKPLVTVITPTIGKQHLKQAIESVQRQTYPNIQHLVVGDGVDIAWQLPESVDFLRLPYNVGADRFNGHRVYGACTYLARGDYVCFLDDDNWFDTDHVETLMNVILHGGNFWACSLRKIIDEDGEFVCNDNCESLGKWPSVFGSPFIDVNCYMLPKMLAVAMSPVWYRRFREPGQMEIDNAMMAFLLETKTAYDCNRQYSVNYKVGNTELSVKKEFFLFNNVAMLRHFNGKVPWSDRPHLDRRIGVSS